MAGTDQQELSSGAQAPGVDSRLRGWKEIARWFGVDERTVKRWEASRGLPIRRVPGEARAPVFAYESELAAWLASGPAGDDDEPTLLQPDPAAASAPGGVAPAEPWWRARRGIIAGAIVAATVVIAAAAWRRAPDPAPVAGYRATAQADDVRQLAISQVAEINERLERQPGTVRLRARLAREAATVLARVAMLPDAPPALARDAAEAYRRLATVESAADRPSLRDRTAARAALAAALRLVQADDSQPGRWLRARILADAARQAAADGAVAKAPPLLAAAAAAAKDAPPALRDELQLANGEVAAWLGDYARAAAMASGLAPVATADADAALRQLRGLDQLGEAEFYAGKKAAALQAYRRAVAAAGAAAARWPADQRFCWALQRQQWNLGTTLIDMGNAAEALVVLAAARHGWMAMAAADPEDESLAAWVRVIRISYGQALTAAGRTGDAVAELSASVADRRRWLAAAPASTERQRALMVGVLALADALGRAGRRSESCLLYDEARDTTRRMTASGGLTRLDRDSEVRLLEEGKARYCAAGLTTLAKPV